MDRIFASSADPEKVSLTVKGALTAFIPFIMLAAKISGAQIEEDFLKEVVLRITDIAIITSTLISSVMVVYGMLRKIYYAIKEVL